jgi:hypothetical protein
VAGRADIDASGIPIQPFDLGLRLPLVESGLTGHGQRLFLWLGQRLALLGWKNHTFLLTNQSKKRALIRPIRSVRGFAFFRTGSLTRHQ